MSKNKRKASTDDHILNFSEKVDFLTTEAANLLSSGESEDDMDKIISFARDLMENAQKKRDELKKKNFPLWCGEESCSGNSCVIVKCIDCEKDVCTNVAKKCDFDDGLGGEGCGELVCGECFQTPECGREVGGCQSCLGDYDCPDCDVCNRY